MSLRHPTIGCGSPYGRSGENAGRIQIGDYCLICPGVRIGAAEAIVIEDNCMIASNAYIADADWHDVYNRISAGRAAPVHIGKNAWIGDSAIVCKGVTIGENSIIGAGSVVTGAIPANTIAAGNPARSSKPSTPRKKSPPGTAGFPIRPGFPVKSTGWTAAT